MFIECRHIFSNGHKCHSPALRGKSFCFHHAKHHFANGAARKTRKFPQPAITDLHSLQTAVNKAVTALSSPHIDTRRAGLLVYGLQLAAHLQARIDIAIKNARRDSIQPDA